MVESPTAPATPCMWREDEDGTWDTNCGEVFVFITDGGPSENKMRFCCYCGGPVISMYFQQENNDEDN